MAKKATPTTTKKPNGVEHVLNQLNTLREHIGAIVVCIVPKAGKRLNHEGHTADAIQMTADLVMSTNDEQRASDCVRTALTQGMVAELAKTHLQRRGGMFG